MENNKLIEKTKKVMETQKELSDLVLDLKNEVRDVYFGNKKLQEENHRLRLELRKHTETETETVITNEVPEVLVKQEVKKEAVTQKSVEPKHQFQKVVHTPKKPSPLMEFFLGKNVIVKIATILIFLGVISFGQLAYVNWLNEFGRVLLIFSTGAFIFGLAFFAEKKKGIVFSNVFYGLSLFVMLYSFILAKDGFGLIDSHVLTYLSLILVIGSFAYFRAKRYEFLDVILFAFYFLSALLFVIEIEPGNSVSLFLEFLIYTTVLGYITYNYAVNYFKDSKQARLVSFLINSLIYVVIVVFFITTVPLNIGSVVFGMFILGLFGTFFGYVTTIYASDKYDPNARFLVAFQTTVILFVSSLLIAEGLSSGFGLTDGSNTILVLIISFIPLYVYLYKQQAKVVTDFKNYFIVIMAGLGILYTFTVGRGYSITEDDFALRNLLLVIEAIIFFVLGKFTKDNIHKFIAYVVGVLVILTNVNFLYQDGTFTFEQSNIIFITMMMGVLMIAINTLFKHFKEDDNKEDSIFAHGVMMVVLIPVVTTFTYDLLSTDIAYLLASVLLLFIGYRYLAVLNIWKVQYRKNFVLIVNTAIVLLTFSINLVYFDHDFSLFSDVFKFTFMFVMNGYIIISLRETYRDFYQEKTEEKFFIILFGIGVLVQSFFIHRYINIEFDKVILSSYFLIASAVGILFGFRKNWTMTRKIGLGSIYFSLGKFFIYDFYSQDLTTFVRMMTYFILGFILLGISFLYAYLEKTYAIQKEE